MACDTTPRIGLSMSSFSFQIAYVWFAEVGNWFKKKRDINNIELTTWLGWVVLCCVTRHLLVLLGGPMGTLQENHSIDRCVRTSV